MLIKQIINELAPSPGYGGDGQPDRFPRIPQKFHKGDVVWISPHPPKYRGHFPNNCPAIVLYSYDSEHGGENMVFVDVDLDDPALSAEDRKYYTDEAKRKANQPHQYGLFVLEKGDIDEESAWFPEGDLTLIPKNTPVESLFTRGNAAPFNTIPAKAKRALAKYFGQQ